MENYIWPGAYSFQLNLKLFLETIKKEIDTILEKIEKIEKLTAR